MCFKHILTSPLCHTATNARNTQTFIGTNIEINLWSNVRRPNTIAGLVSVAWISIWIKCAKCGFLVYCIWFEANISYFFFLFSRVFPVNKLFLFCLRWKFYRNIKQNVSTVSVNSNHRIYGQSKMFTTNSKSSWTMRPSQNKNALIIQRSGILFQVTKLTIFNTTKRSHKKVPRILVFVWCNGNLIPTAGYNIPQHGKTVCIH